MKDSFKENCGAASVASETRELGIEQGDKAQTSTVTRSQNSVTF